MIARMNTFILRPAIALAAMTFAAPAVAQQTAPATPAPPAEAPATGAAQVALIVDSEFATYDQDKSGALDEKECAAWLHALRMKADARAPVDAAYNKAAFRQADTDKSKTVSRDELVAFLTPAAPAA